LLRRSNFCIYSSISLHISYVNTIIRFNPIFCGSLAYPRCNFGPVYLDQFELLDRLLSVHTSSTAKGMFMHVCLPISNMSRPTTVRPTGFVIVLTLQFAPLHIHLCQTPAFLVYSLSPVILSNKEHIMQNFFLLLQIISTHLKLMRYSTFCSRRRNVSQADCSFPVINFGSYPTLFPADNLLNEFA